MAGAQGGVYDSWAPAHRLKQGIGKGIPAVLFLQVHNLPYSNPIDIHKGNRRKPHSEGTSPIHYSSDIPIHIGSPSAASWSPRLFGFGGQRNAAWVGGIAGSIDGFVFGAAYLLYTQLAAIDKGVKKRLGDGVLISEPEILVE